MQAEQETQVQPVADNRTKSNGLHPDKECKRTGHWGELMVEQRKGNQQRRQRNRVRNVLGSVIS